MITHVAASWVANDGGVGLDAASVMRERLAYRAHMSRRSRFLLCQGIMRTMRRWFSRRRWIVVTAALTAATSWLLAIGGRGVAVATVLTFTVAVLTLAVTGLGFSGQATSSDRAALGTFASVLARAIGVRERTQQHRFLADVGAGRPADLAFTQPASLHWRTDGGESRGTLGEIASFYRGLGNGRLVVLGHAGAGKTVLANQLLLDMIKARPATASLPESIVPVRVSLSSVNIGDDCEYSESQEIRKRLDTWLVRHISDVYSVAPRMARALLENGWILPVLDGLDEVDPESGPPVRAAAIVRAFNSAGSVMPSPVVITCRTSRYTELAKADSLPGRDQVLQDATVVEVQPLTCAQVADFLSYRFPDPRNHAQIQRRWQPVITHITKHPGSSLAAALSSPLRLFLAVTAYHSSSTTPAELVHIKGSALDHHLLRELIPATVALAQGGHDVTAEKVRRWLTTIANYLRVSGDDDIALDRLWAAAGRRAPRYITAALLAFSVLVAFSVPSAVLIYSYGQAAIIFPIPYRFGTRAFYIYPLVMLLVALYIFWRASRAKVVLRRMELPTFATSAGRSRIAVVVMWMILSIEGALGLFPWRSSGSSFFGGGNYALFAVGTPLALTGLAIGLGRRPSTVTRIKQVVNQGLFADLVVVVVPAFSFGMGILILEFPASTSLVLDQPSGLLWFFHYAWPPFLIGLAFGLIFGVTFRASSPWPRYVVATVMLAVSHRLPWRPAHFLDWAYHAGLLRLSGLSVQFRHQDVLDFLAQDPDS